MADRCVTDERLRTWAVLLETYSVLVDVLEDELVSETGLPLTWYDVLVHLSAAPGGRLRMNELASSVLLSKSGITRLADRMEKAGLIERVSCPTDRRVVFAALTPAGRTAMRRAAPVHARGVDEHFNRHLTRREAEALASGLEKVLVAARRAAPRAAAS